MSNKQQKADMAVATREEEREELLELNDRLEAYVANTRALRHAAETVTDRMSNAQKNYENQLNKLEVSYRAQIEAVKRNLDEEMNNSVKLKDRITELESELVSAQAIVKDVPRLRKELAELDAQLAQAEAEGQAAENRGNTLESNLKNERSNVNDLTKKLKEAQTQLAVLTAEHRAARDEVTSLREERRKDLENAKERLSMKVAETKRDLENLHSKKLDELELRLRNQYSKEINQLKERLDNVNATNERSRADTSKTSSLLTAEKDFSNGLLKKITAMEETHKKELEDWATERDHFNKDLASEREASAKLQEDYQRVLGRNISLQAEIDHYARILAEEESRVGLTPSPSSKKRRTEPNESSLASPIASSVSIIDGILGFMRGSNTPGKTTITTTELNSNTDVTTTTLSSTTNADSWGGDEDSDASKAGKGKKGKITKGAVEDSASKAKKRGRNGRSSGREDSSGDEEIGFSAPADLDTALDLEADKVVVVNTSGNTVNLEGYKLISEVGNQVYTFPTGVILTPNAGVTVWSGPKAPSKYKWPTDLIWSSRYMWNNEGDTAVLYDAEGNLISKITTERASRYDAHDLRITIDLESEVVIITNTSADNINLGNWSIRSDVGNQTFTFPKNNNSILKPNQTVNVYSGRTAESHRNEPSAFVWTHQNIWNNHGDSATLYDPKNRRVSRVAGSHHGDIVNGERRQSCIIM